MSKFIILDENNTVINAIEADSKEFVDSIYPDNASIQILDNEVFWIGGSYSEKGFMPPLSEKPENRIWDYDRKSWMPEVPMPPEPEVGFWVWNDESGEWEIPQEIFDLPNDEEILFRYNLDINRKPIPVDIEPGN